MRKKVVHDRMVPFSGTSWSATVRLRFRDEACIQVAGATAAGICGFKVNITMYHILPETLFLSPYPSYVPAPSIEDPCRAVEGLFAQ